MITSSTVLIEYEIFDSAKETTKVTVSKLWLVYYVLSMQIYLLSTRQILQSRLRVKGDKSGFTFHDKSDNVVLSATPNLWGNIQIIKTHILKHDVSNSVSLATRHLNFKTLYCYFGHVLYS